jgi:outer membrane receptor protein involved in Fe transport
MAKLAVLARILVPVLVCLSSSTLLFGQTAVSSIVGTVRDATGAVVAGANVTILNTATKTTREAATNSVGDYVVPYLGPGKYQVTAEMPGFQKTLIPDLNLSVNQVMRVDLDLSVGEVTEQVTIAGTLVQELQTQTSEVSSVIGRKEISDLPLNGRNFLQLALLTEGVYRPAEGTGANSFAPGISSGTGGVTGISANGLREHYSTATVDGTNIYNLGSGYIGMFTSTDAVQEFRIVTGNNSTDFGRVAGASMNLTLRQGTNSLHGSVYEFLRNDNLDAADFFALPGLKPEFRRNQFGFVVAGPVVLPKIYNGHNRTFFMANYEGLRQQRPDVRRVQVPTPAQLMGDLSAIAQPIIDPLTGLQFPGNIIPTNRIAPVSLNFASYYPTPNTPGTPNFTVRSPSPLSTNGGNFRVDHVFSPKDTFFTSYSFVDLESQPITALPAFLSITSNRTQRASLSYVHVFTSQFLLNARLGMFRIRNTGKSGRSDVEDVRPKLGINYPISPANFGVPGVTIAGLQGLGDLRKTLVAQTTFEPSIDLTHNYRSHTFKYGLSYIRDGLNLVATELGLPAFNFTGQFTGNALADFLLGYLGRSQRSIGAWDPHIRQYHMGAYFGDTWRATSRLTFNVGLRYDFNSPYTEAAAGRIASFNQISGQLEYPANCAICPTPKGRFGNAVNASYKRDWGPRAGLAYQLAANTVLRAAYGIYWNPEFSGGTETSLNPPFQSSFIAFPSATTPDLTWEIAFPASGSTVPSNLSGGATFLNVREQNWLDGYVQQWNLALERQLPGNFLITGSYIGSKGTHLPWTLDVNTRVPGDPSLIQPNRPFPNYSYIQINSPQATSNYHAFALRAQRRFSTGITVLMTYTISKAISKGEDSLFGSGSGGGVYFPRIAPISIRREASHYLTLLRNSALATFGIYP